MQARVTASPETQPLVFAVCMVTGPSPCPRVYAGRGFISITFEVKEEPRLGHLPLPLCPVLSS